MSSTYCKICDNHKIIRNQLPDTITPDTVLIELECGHTFNWVNGECYTKEEMKDIVGILSRTISRLMFESGAKKRMAIKAVEDII